MKYKVTKVVVSKDYGSSEWTKSRKVFELSEEGLSKFVSNLKDSGYAVLKNGHHYFKSECESRLNAEEMMSDIQFEVDKIAKRRWCVNTNSEHWDAVRNSLKNAFMSSNEIVEWYSEHNGQQIELFIEEIK